MWTKILLSILIIHLRLFMFCKEKNTFIGIILSVYIISTIISFKELDEINTALCSLHIVRNLSQN